MNGSKRLREPPLTTASPDVLARDGFSILKVFDADEAAVARWEVLNALWMDSSCEFQPAFLATCRDVCEGADPGNDYDRHLRRLVLSSMGNLGHAVAFHHPAVRRIHSIAFAVAAEAVKSIVRPGEHVQMLADRVTLRPAGTSLKLGTWHRDLPSLAVLAMSGRTHDEIETILNEDVILQTYVNLSAGDAPFHFVGVPGSHYPHGARLPGEAASLAGFSHVRPPPADGSWKTVTLRPGEMVLFYASCVHAVAAHAVPVGAPAALRVHTGLRITADPRPLWPDLAEALEAQGPPRTPSGEPAGIVGASALGQPYALEWLTAAFGPETAARVDAGPGGHGLLPSLQTLGLPLFPAYTRAELAAFGIQ